jgi:hypothetical protein
LCDCPFARPEGAADCCPDESAGRNADERAIAALLTVTGSRGSRPDYPADHSTEEQAESRSARDAAPAAADPHAPTYFELYQTREVKYRPGGQCQRVAREARDAGREARKRFGRAAPDAYRVTRDDAQRGGATRHLRLGTVGEYHAKSEEKYEGADRMHDPSSERVAA